jgi:hypothetical protein
MPLLPFRFGDLPRELRDRIYRELLCDFRPRPTSIAANALFALEPAKNDIHASILRTSKTVYAEAYDTMIKTNRFVKITASQNVPLGALLNGMRVRVVTPKKKAVDSFKSYVLGCHVGASRDIPIQREGPATELSRVYNVMVLHRDMDVFCSALMDGDVHCPGITRLLQITITVAPILSERQPSKHSPPLDDFFSVETQKSLLATFRTALRGFQYIRIEGHVEKSLARDVEGEIQQDLWSDPKQVLADFMAAKAKGSKLFQQGKKDEGSLEWADAALEIDKMVQSSSWEALVKRGGESFVSQLAEPYFLVRLNVAHVQIMSMSQRPGSAYFAGVMAEDNLNMAVKAIMKDYWMKVYRYRPSIQHLAKLRYRYALLLRLQAEPGTEDRASKYIESALQLQPGDPAIVKERDNIVAWVQRGF